MTKPVISLLAYQVGVTNPLQTPQLVGLHVGSIRGGIFSTRRGINPQPIAESGVFNETLARQVYSYIEYVTPSNTGVQRIYTNKTVAEIVADINS